MSNLQEENTILVGRLDALSKDHTRVCNENVELKNQIKALKAEIATNTKTSPNMVFVKREFIDLIMHQALIWAKQFNIKVDSYKTEGSKTTLVLDSGEDQNPDLFNDMITILQSEITKEIDKQEAK